jgi:hypothetical protein
MVLTKAGVSHQWTDASQRAIAIVEDPAESLATMNPTGAPPGRYPARQRRVAARRVNGHVKDD